MYKIFRTASLLLILGINAGFLAACIPQSVPVAKVQAQTYLMQPVDEFAVADGSRPLTFPADFGAHPDFRTEWWYYTGNLSTPDARSFGFELTVFRVGLIPPTVDLPEDSVWYDESL